MKPTEPHILTPPHPTPSAPLLCLEIVKNSKQKHWQSPSRAQHPEEDWKQLKKNTLQAVKASSLPNALLRVCWHLTGWTIICYLHVCIFGEQTQLFWVDFPAKLGTVTDAGEVFLSPRRVIARQTEACSTRYMCGMTRAYPSCLNWIWQHFLITISLHPNDECSDLYDLW